MKLTFDIFGQNISLNIHALTDLAAAERGRGECVWNQGDAESVGFNIHERQAYAVDGDGSFARHLTELRRWSAEPHCGPIRIILANVERADGVDMAGDVMPADRIARF